MRARILLNNSFSQKRMCRFDARKVKVQEDSKAHDKTIEKKDQEVRAETMHENHSILLKIKMQSKQSRNKCNYTSFRQNFLELLFQLIFRLLLTGIVKYKAMIEF